MSQEYEELLAQYPEIIQEHLGRVFDTVIEVLGEDRIKSIILVGSASRAEMSFISHGNELDIYSDYEYVVITHNIISASLIKKLKKRNVELAREFKIKSPLFSIDFGVSAFSKWKLTPPTLWAFEVLNLGVTVYGEEVKKFLGPIGLKNLDLGNLNHLILVRLWNMFVHLPKSCIVGEPSKYEELIGKLYYARNILDILTVYLPHQNILQAGYENRINAFTCLKSSIFNEQEIENIVHANNFKLYMQDHLSFESAQRTFFFGYLKLLANISTMEEWDYSPDSLTFFIDKVASKNPFNEKILKKGRRIVNESKMYFRMLTDHFDKDTLLWFFLDKRYCVLGVLVSLHAVLIKQYTSSEQKKFIQVAINYIEKLTLQKINLGSSDIYCNVDELRKILHEFMLSWFYANRLVDEEEILDAMDYREYK